MEDFIKEKGFRSLHSSLHAMDDASKIKHHPTIHIMHLETQSRMARAKSAIYHLQSFLLNNYTITHVGQYSIVCLYNKD